MFVKRLNKLWSTLLQILDETRNNKIKLFCNLFMYFWRVDKQNCHIYLLVNFHIETLTCYMLNVIFSHLYFYLLCWYLSKTKIVWQKLFLDLSLWRKAARKKTCALEEACPQIIITKSELNRNKLIILLVKLWSRYSFCKYD